jgi:hypothetical protein
LPTVADLGCNQGLYGGLSFHYDRLVPRLSVNPGKLGAMNDDTRLYSDTVEYTVNQFVRSIDGGLAEYAWEVLRFRGSNSRVVATYKSRHAAMAAYASLSALAADETA